MLLAKDSDKSYNYYENLDNSQQDEYNIVLKANKGDKLALEYIISKYKNFVKAKAKSYFLVGADKEDIQKQLGWSDKYYAIRYKNVIDFVDSESIDYIMQKENMNINKK